MKEKSTGGRSSSRVAWESLENWARLEIQDWLQELMVAEVTELLGREKSERRKPSRRTLRLTPVSCGITGRSLFCARRVQKLERL